MNTLRVSPNAYVDALLLPELQAELVLAACRLVGTRVVASGLSSDFFVCRECAGRGRDRHAVQHLPECVAGFVARLLLTIAHREAEQVSLPHRKEPSPQENRSSEPAQTAVQERRPFVLPKGQLSAAAVEEFREAWDAAHVGPGAPILPALYDEPWTVEADGDVYNAQGHTVVDMHGCTLAEPDDLHAMRRIAACVNHCKGVPTEELTRETERATAGGGR